MCPRSTPPARTAALAALVAAAVTAGCAVLPKDVGRFGQATVSLTTRFAPLAGRAGQLCRERLVLREAATADSFDARRALEAARVSCRDVIEAERRLIADAGVLQAYGRELAARSGEPVDGTAGDLDAIERVAQEIGGLAGEAVSAVARLARVLHDGLRADATRRLTARTVREAHEPLAAFVAQLRAHARDTVVPAVDDAIDQRRRLLDETLVPASAAAGRDAGPRWPLRLAQVDLMRDLERLQAERRQLEAFDAAAAALVEAHARLRDSFDAPQAPARAEAVRTFVDRLRRLHEAATGA